jgi:hypothetical protein
MNRRFQELGAILLDLTAFCIMLLLMTYSLHPVCCAWQVNDILMFIDPKEKTKSDNNYIVDDITPSGVHIPKLYGVYNLQDIICIVYNCWSLFL